MIKLNRLTYYAVVLLTHLVSDGQPTRAQSIAQLAVKSSLSFATASKVLKKLKKAKVVGSILGPAGGYCLLQDPFFINIADIVEAMDGPLALTKCAKEGEYYCKIEKSCPMNGRWNPINRAVRRALEEVSLADMAVQCKRPQHQTMTTGAAPGKKRSRTEELTVAEISARAG